MECLKSSSHELYKVAWKADGSAVRGDDAEPELLEDEEEQLHDSTAIMLAVKEKPLKWHYCCEDVDLSERGRSMAAWTGGDMQCEVPPDTQS
jgi:hypothetical protein